VTRSYRNLGSLFLIKSKWRLIYMRDGWLEVIELSKCLRRTHIKKMWEIKYYGFQLTLFLKCPLNDVIISVEEPKGTSLGNRHQWIALFFFFFFQFSIHLCLLSRHRKKNETLNLVNLGFMTNSSMVLLSHRVCLVTFYLTSSK